MSCCVCCRLVVADRSSPPRRCRLGVPSAAGRVPERPNVADEPAEHSGRQRARCHGHGGLAGGPCGGSEIDLHCQHQPYHVAVIAYNALCGGSTP